MYGAWLNPKHCNNGWLAGKILNLIIDLKINIDKCFKMNYNNIYKREEWEYEEINYRTYKRKI